jgi:3-hydroxyisobutyrate dehydrogenase-like beta-hydroxyacid dehydrogenase
MMDAAYPIGFIGLGTMGQAMALALVKAGTRLLVWKCSGQNEKAEKQNLCSYSVARPGSRNQQIC